jgi:hypothetical protein
LHRERGNAARHRHAELAQDLFALVFVDLHRGGSCGWAAVVLYLRRPEE